MPAAKPPYREGDWFALALPDGRWAAGRVAHMRRGGRLIAGYFFGPARPAAPSLAEVRELRAGDAAMVRLCRDSALGDGRWPILGQDGWDRDAWPMPCLRNYDPFTEEYARIVHEPPDMNGTRVRHVCTREAWERCIPDEYLGAGVVVEQLAELLGAGAPASAPPPMPEDALAAVLGHYLYFPTESSARDAADTLRGRGYNVDVRLSASHPTRWLALARRPLSDDVDGDAIEQEAGAVAPIAAQHGGEYDGWEASVGDG